MTMTRKVAVIDGTGEAATVELYLEDDDGETLKDLPWPTNWPKRVTPGYLKDRGYDVIIA